MALFMAFLTGFFNRFVSALAFLKLNVSFGLFLKRLCS